MKISLKSIFSKKKTVYFILLTIIGLLLFNQNFLNLKNKFFDKYPNLDKEYIKNLFVHESKIKNLENDYNVKFLPNTQFTNLNYKKIKINFENEKKKSPKTFFIEIQDNYILIIRDNGVILKSNLSNLVSTKKNSFFKNKKIRTNLENLQILDTHLHNNKLFLYYSEIKDGCKNINISFSLIDENFFEFKKIYSSNECQKNEIQVDRLISYKHKGIDGLLIATNFFIRDKPSEYLSQNDKSIFGKILFFNLITNKQTIFSKGHRAIQGLYSEDNLILSTEHGPKGGDEINKIVYNGNYGWPIASYGEFYAEDNKTNSNKYSEKPVYLKDHARHGFIEPLFAFIPSIGISEIIRLPDNFSEHFKKNFLVTSLNDKSIYRVKFDKSYNKLIFSEKIFIGDRIRDIKYDYKSKTVFLALEYNGEIGILKNN